ncbi:MAG: cytochrome c [Gemmatimonadaceae bacterium]
MNSLTIARHRLTRAGAGLAILAGPYVMAQSPAPSPAPGAMAFFTAEQAERGQQLFTAVCVECHTRSDMSNDDFRFKWGGRTARDLYDRTRTTMPDNAPGSRTAQEYTDLVAYMMQLNGMPSGAVPLSADSNMANAKLELSAPPGA